MRAVHRNADAAAHDDAVDQRDVGLAIVLDAGVERIFVAPERQRLVVLAGLAEIVERADIAAGRERPAARRRDDDARDRRIVCPVLQLRRQRPHHAVRHGVERLRPVERDEAGRAAPLEQNFDVAHAAAPRDRQRSRRSRARCGRRAAGPTARPACACRSLACAGEVALRRVVGRHDDEHRVGPGREDQQRARAASASRRYRERQQAEHAGDDGEARLHRCAARYSSAAIRVSSAGSSSVEPRRLLGDIDIDRGAGEQRRRHQCQDGRRTSALYAQCAGGDHTPAASRLRRSPDR